MPLDPVALAVPVFLLLMGLELRAQRRSGRRLYRFEDTVSNLGAGIGSEVLRLGLGAVSLGIYAWVYRAWRLFDLPGWGSALVAFLGVDFLYYWFHRLCHRVNLLWALHVVHHHSQDMNLGVALRQSWFQGFFNLPLYLPLALLGVPPAHFAVAVGLSLVYQFWIHTETIGKLGVFEEVLNTASHHRVHHGVNPRYIDRNHGATLIVWDRLFGTFEREREPVVYGTVKPLESWNPVWSNFTYFRDLWRHSRATRRWRDKLAVWFSDPSWLPEDLGGPQQAPEVDARRFSKWNHTAARPVRRWVQAHLASTTLLLGALLFGAPHLPWPALALLGAWIVGATASWGGWLDTRAWARPFDLARHAAAALALAAAVPWLGLPVWAAVGGSALVTASAAWMLRLPHPQAANPLATA